MPRGSNRPAGRRRTQGSSCKNAASAARLAALSACRIVRERDAYAQEVIQSTIDRSGLSQEDRAFATLLVLGVVSTVGTLDELIDRSLRSPSDIKPDVRDALRISAYELAFLHKEAYAAIDQGVELVRAVAPRAAGVGNAALRHMQRLLPSFPFGDPETDLAAYARLQGFPLWLAELLKRDLGDAQAREFMRISNEPAPLFVADNPLIARPGEVVSELERAKAACRPVEEAGIRIPGCWAVTPSRVLADGRIRHLIGTGKMLVSDASSQCVANLVLPERQPRTFLEVGAGRGTKTILLEAASMRRWGSALPAHAALDNHAFKIRLLLDRVRSYGYDQVEGVVADASHLDGELGGRRFDAVFIDAPCSGLGTLRRHPEIRWRLTSAHVSELAETQLRLLRSAARCVEPGGTLAYATCTVTHEENIEVAKRFLQSPEGAAFSLAPIGGASCFSPLLSSGGPDAHFAVLFENEKAAQ
ncbi:MAG: transcription antitermination factor NusB [Eggerthellaceae bacterium]|nr:transcription antitermination factor NusB [Eggerthellaceae bacterium]